MKKLLQLITRLFEILVRLFPKDFQDEFEQELSVVFSAMAREGAKEGGAKLMIVCFRELVDFPIALFRAYFLNSRMREFFGSPSVKYALRGAMGYSLFFIVVNLTSYPIVHFLFDQRTWILKNFLEDKPLFIRDILTLLVELIGFSCATLFGSLFISIFFSDRSHDKRFIVAASLTWLIPQMVLQAFFTQVNVLYVDTNHTIFFEIVPDALVGAFIGVLFIVSRRVRPETIRYLAIGVVLYPAFTFIYSKLLNTFVPLNSFLSMIAVFLLIAVLVSGVVYGTLRNERKVPWLVIAGAVVYPLLNGLYFLLFFRFHLFPDFSNPFLNDLIFNTFIGVWIGVSLGFIAGRQTENAI